MPHTQLLPAPTIEGETERVSAVPANPEDDHLDAIFGDLVTKSWDWYSDHTFARSIDEVLVGATITGVLDLGHVLIDLTSDGTRHFLRFENTDDQSRLAVRLHHLTGDLTTAKVQGHKASVVVGYGERVRDFTNVWQAIKAELKSGLVARDEPGAISVDGDATTQYVYVQCRLILDVDNYVSRDWSTNTDLLSTHLGACRHALRKYLRGRFA